ncbi:hypothetical protein IAQ61_000721 [Plenodomus lingam]|uniref:uncharacterized protein n=1 Tax=Leptosphaeria maculans TaxID=5022 RepID=UPI00332A4EB0|nr:hypothetical protein IAQ61_000721 [Plenodomus lingam]
MGLTSLQLGLLITGCCGVAVTCILARFHTYPRPHPLPFSHRTQHQHPNAQDIELQAHNHIPSCTSSVNAQVEKFGELYIPPDRKPLHVGLDVITRMFLATGLPAHTLHRDAVSAMEQGLASRLSVRGSPWASGSRSEMVGETLSAGQVTALGKFAAESNEPVLIEAVCRIQSAWLGPSLDSGGTADGGWLSTRSAGRKKCLLLGKTRMMMLRMELWF